MIGMKNRKIVIRSTTVVSPDVDRHQELVKNVSIVSTQLKSLELVQS